MEFVEAVIEASAIRLRPVLMTSLCTLFGAVPLLLASGAGAESRRAIGAVVVYGIGFSCLLTLYIVPTLYKLLARNSRSPEYVSRMLERVRSAHSAAAEKPATPPPAPESP